MTQTRREFFTTGAAVAGTITLLPFALRAEGHGADTFDTPAGKISVHPVNHASIVLETPKGTIYVDPVGDAAQYEGMPAPDLILITHEHGDHYNEETLQALVTDETQMIVNPAVMGKLTEGLKERASDVANGSVSEFNTLSIQAIPAYNTTEERMKFHPKGRDNGYVLNFEDFRIYISGDTEDIPEMRSLTDIDLAFVCMNLPFTMDANAAASAVSEFAPTYVYPYHYRGRDGGTQDPESFAKMIGGETEVKLGNWYS
ncbi:MBL fold metallo-hydrolase [Sulfitobacter sp. F26204]|uniref:MBL fold metallo-hydrolase n=1 Tax=Sulfitobacter sp. F26204 TaxID=2996014 RepID=UPI00225E3521|nr:MBL fold metallo-hydrolase [Sulfitobacter sp. F26204]MCX7560434.1 MBL fold metallo-hydrolase [Sulfitobacter sp. F26204]